jgi:hypothetical protein
MGSEHGNIPVMDIARVLFQVITDLFSLVFFFTRSRVRLAAENLFLRKQLAFYKERGIKPGRIDSGSRFTLIALSRFFDWKDALAVVQGVVA